MFLQKILVIDAVHSVIMYGHWFCWKTAIGCIGSLQRTQKSQKRSQNGLFYAIMKTSGIMKFFLPNLLVPKNVASVKCKRVETVKKYGPEHGISLNSSPKAVSGQRCLCPAWVVLRGSRALKKTKSCRTQGNLYVRTSVRPYVRTYLRTSPPASLREAWASLWEA